MRMRDLGLTLIALSVCLIVLLVLSSWLEKIKEQNRRRDLVRLLLIEWTKVFVFESGCLSTREYDELTMKAAVDCVAMHNDAYPMIVKYGPNGTDPWGNSIRLQKSKEGERINVVLYSPGVNGLDESGGGDDISLGFQCSVRL